MRVLNGNTIAGMKSFLNKMNSTAQKVRLGQIAVEKKDTVMGVYDFAVNGGAVGTSNLLDENGLAIVIPDNAIITNVLIDIVTAIVSTGGDGTIALDSEADGDLLAAVDGDTLSGIAAGVPVGSAATAIKMTAARTLTITIATAVLTAGKIAVHVEWTPSI